MHLLPSTSYSTSYFTGTNTTLFLGSLHLDFLSEVQGLEPLPRSAFVKIYIRSASEHLSARCAVLDIGAWGGGVVREASQKPVGLSRDNNLRLSRA